MAARLALAGKKTEPKRQRSHPDEWRGFGATNEEGSCRWCGEQLIRHYRYDPGVAMKRNVAAALEYGLGPYEDGYFCSLRCGYQFGARLASLGDKLS